jgi:hypothetical protein
LPKIGASNSVAAVRSNIAKEAFSLRFVNDPMPAYNPSKDKFSNYYGKDGKIKGRGKPSSSGRSRVRSNRSSMKTLPAEPASKT